VDRSPQRGDRDDSGQGGLRRDRRIERGQARALLGRHRSGDRGSRGGEGEDKRESYFERQLATYYDDVIARVRDAGAIFIFGPGEAKGELKSRIEHEGLGGRIVGVEAADKMTPRQISAKVRQRFARRSLPKAGMGP
jgi:hypothetical protein